MDKNNNAICPVCGKSFKACHSCLNNKLESWKNLTDTLDCYKVFKLLQSYCVDKTATKEETKAKLKDFDFSDIDTYPDTTKAAIKDILGIKTEPKTAPKTKTIKK